MNPILYEIITTLLTACGIAIAGFVIPYLRKAAQAAEAKLRNSDHELAAEIMRWSRRYRDSIEGMKNMMLPRKRSMTGLPRKVFHLQIQRLIP